MTGKQAGFSRTIDIAAPAARVWDVMRDVERWAEWTASVTSIRRLGSGPLAAGSKLEIRQPKLPPAVWTVVEVIEGRSFTSTTGGPGVLVTARHWIEPIPSGCRVSLSLAFTGFFGGIVARLCRTLNNRYLDLEAAGLKRRSEGG